jgi:hypothetical protein
MALLDFIFIAMWVMMHIGVALFVRRKFSKFTRRVAPVTQFSQLFTQALLVAIMCQIGLLGALVLTWRLFNVSTEGLILFSPASFAVILFFSIRHRLPNKLKALSIWRFFKATSPSHKLYDEYSDYIVAPENLDITNPIGLTNPSSPNYIGKHNIHSH